ncbi:hypothetical protein SAMN02910384_00035 [Pseudobutyrivibrio sp. ACV-2]|uniref:hypothetical protein n=1 Tax=Pseudobutyrivibrio sp. ACV-2 TaxID=1520801 RepID=UPI000894B5DF|nr:hypothetical protein [Pseudobutyrivibrio sp. ACV-2]SDZ77106.1 hypothetical protein SAMN02910384_00035 [Pseudobutyrivibrio sp. ACV-2]
MKTDYKNWMPKGMISGFATAAIPGYDPDVRSDFSSIEEISAELEGFFSNCI